MRWQRLRWRIENIALGVAITAFGLTIGVALGAFIFAALGFIVEVILKAWPHG
jgi:hypothetical protein